MNSGDLGDMTYSDVFQILLAKSLQIAIYEIKLLLCKRQKLS